MFLCFPGFDQKWTKKAKVKNDDDRYHSDYGGDS